MKEKNDNLDKIIDKSKPFEDQIKSFKKVENLDDDYYDDNFDDKELKYTLKQNLQKCQMRLTKNFLNKYLVIYL